MDPKETEGLSTRLLSREQSVMTGASPSVLHLLNVGLRITEALDPVESSRESMFDIVSLLNVGLGNIKSLDRVESSYNNDLLFFIVPNFVLRVCGHSLVVVLTGASTSDIVPLLNVGLESIKSLDCVESSSNNDLLFLSVRYNNDLLFLSVPNFVLRVCGHSLVVVLTGASTSDVVPLLNVGLRNIKSLDPAASSNNCDLLLLSVPHLILRVSGFSLIIWEKGNGLWCVILEVANCEGEVFHSVSNFVCMTFLCIHCKRPWNRSFKLKLILQFRFQIFTLLDSLLIITTNQLCPNTIA